MAQISVGALSDDTDRVLRRVEAGEVVTITLDGRPVAVMQPIESRQRWVKKSAFVAGLRQADPGLTAALRGLAPSDEGNVGV